MITIAHRLEAVKYADYYITLKNGRIAAQGSTTTEIMQTEMGDLARTEN